MLTSATGIIGKWLKTTTVCALLAGPVLAGPITFQSPVPFGPTVNALTPPVGSTLHGAVNFGPQGAATNGITTVSTGNIPNSVSVGSMNFVAVNTAGSVATTTAVSGQSTDTPFVNYTVDANFNTVLNSDAVDVTAPFTFDVTITGLTSGSSYWVQLFAVRGSGVVTQSFSSVGGNTLTYNTGGAANPQYVIGTFLATGATQTFTVSALAGGAFLSAMVVRNLVPEIDPGHAGSAIAFLALFIVGFFDRRLRSQLSTGAY